MRFQALIECSGKRMDGWMDICMYLFQSFRGKCSLQEVRAERRTQNVQRTTRADWEQTALLSVGLSIGLSIGLLGVLVLWRRGLQQRLLLSRGTCRRRTFLFLPVLTAEAGLGEEATVGEDAEDIKHPQENADTHSRLQTTTRGLPKVRE